MEARNDCFKIGTGHLPGAISINHSSNQPTRLASSSHLEESHRKHVRTGKAGRRSRRPGRLSLVGLCRLLVSSVRILEKKRLWQ